MARGARILMAAARRAWPHFFAPISATFIDSLHNGFCWPSSARTGRHYRAGAMSSILDADIAVIRNESRAADDET